MKKNDKNIDPFILREVYPEVDTIFSFHLTPLDSIKDSCIFVIDTNSLLIPYETGKDPLDKIKETYSKLIDEGRLFIPGTVAREFAKNRTNRILNLYKKIKDKHSNLRSIMKPLKFYTIPYPLLESIKEYQNTLDLEKKIDENNKKLLEDYKRSVNGVLDNIKNWTWNDPVSTMYGELFKKDIFVDIEITDEIKESLFQEMKKRYEHRIPPGYKDSSNESKGSGDFLIWKTILEIAKKHSNDLVFVSGDKKSDWFHRIDNEPLYPRYELVDEYRRNSSGKSFHIISFARFLEILGVNEEIVQVVKEREVRLLTSSISERHGMVDIIRYEERIALDWLKSQYPNTVSTRAYGSIFDFILTFNKDKETKYHVGFKIKNIRMDDTLINYFYDLIREIEVEVISSNLKSAFLVLIFSNPNIANYVYSDLTDHSIYSKLVQIFGGCIDNYDDYTNIFTV